MKLLTPYFLASIFLFLIGCKNDVSKVPEGFEIMEGYDLELVASEPLIADPVDLEFDENGDAFVLEMPGYPFEDKHSRIVKLIDSNKDGVFDDKVIYAEQLQLASSILPFKDGMLVAGPPYLLYVKDTDGDGITDQRDTLMGGFSTGNLQHNYNGLTYGLDNWIYAANGGNSGSPFWWGDTSSVIDLRGDDIRINLEDKIIERIGYSSGGFELAIDDHGRIFETHNLEHISLSVFSGRYINDAKLLVKHTLENVSDHEEGGLSRIYPIGEQESRVNHPEQSGYFSGACGITHYGGGNMGQLNGSVWIADVVLNLIHLDLISENGASFTASRYGVKEDFIASSDRSFRPVNMTVGPQGEMYVVDMYRQVIEHPEWIPDEIEKTLDLEAGKDKGRIYRVTAKSAFTQVHDFESTSERIKSLGSPNQWVRNTAHRLLMEKSLSQTDEEALRKTLSSDNLHQRLHGRWILHQQNKLSINEVVDGLKDVVSGNRENALIISEKYLSDNPDIAEVVFGLLSDENQRVRMQAALSLSVLSTAERLEFQNKILDETDSMVKMSLDKWNIAALTILVSPFAETALEKIALLDHFESKIEVLQSLIQTSSDSPDKIQGLLDALANSELSNDQISDLINTMNPNGSLGDERKTILPILSKMEEDADNILLAALTGLRKKVRIGPSSMYLARSKEALMKVLNNDHSIESRLDNLELLQHLPFESKDVTLYSLCDNSQPVQLQTAALKQIWDADDTNIGYELVKRWRTMGPQARRSASDILLYKESHHDALLTGLEDSVINIGEMNFDLERRRTLLWWTDNEETKRRAELLFSDSGVINRKEAMEEMSVAISQEGHIENGQLVFEQLCAQCHIYDGEGSDVGPVLTEINRKSKESLLHDIIDPNAAVDTKYINHKIETKDGRIIFGMVDLETDNSITLKNSGGLVNTIEKSEIENFQSLGTSLMMEGLEANMSHSDMADLLAFLQQPINL